MAKIIGYLKRNDGVFYAKDAAGHLRKLEFGDAIFAGEVVVELVKDQKGVIETVIAEHANSTEKIIETKDDGFDKMPKHEDALQRLDTATSEDIVLPISNLEVNINATLRNAEFVENTTEDLTQVTHSLDSRPTANPDTATVDEDFTGVVNGNVFSKGQSGDVADSLGGDGGVSQPVIGVQVGSTSGEVRGGLGTTLVGTYGTLVLQADGSYVYDLDENAVVTQALVDGEVGKDVFTYTIVDSDGDTATTTLTINVIGEDDPAYIVIPPQTVYEAGLPDGTLADDSDKVVDKEILIQAKDVLDTVTIGTKTLTLAELQDLATNNVSIDTGEGTITLTDYNFQLTGFVTSITYTYELKDNLDHPTAGGNNTLEDDIAVSVVDVNGSVASGTMAITIVDDVPVTVDDANEITEDAVPNTVTGNVYSTTGASSGDNADNIGADAVTPDTPVTAETIVGAYGTLVIAADGSYVYTLDNDNPVVNALNDGDTLTEDLTYTVTDNDGDAVTGTLEMTIHGTTDPVLIVDDTIVNEDDGTMTFTVRLEDASGNPGSSARDVTFDYATSDGTATAGSDYTATNGSAVITAGTSSTTITVPLIDDYIADNGETFDVTLSNVNTAASIDVAAGADPVGTATIEDDSKAGTPYDDSDDATEPDHEYVTLKLVGLDDSGAPVGLANTVVEGEASSYMVVLVDPDGNLITTAAGTVNVVLSDGTALATNPIAGMPGDYDGTSPLSVTVGTPFTVQTTDDFTSDNGENFSVAIANDQSYSDADKYENVIHDTTAVTTTITDGPAEPGGEDVTTLSISGDTSVGEGATANYTLTVDHAPETDLVVEVTISHITTDNADFDPTLSYTQNVTILAGQTTANFTIDNLDDTVYEGSETYVVDISNVTGGQYEQLAIGTQNVTTEIVDNETPPELSITDIVVNEDDGTATFTVTASGTAQRDMDFTYDTSDGSATAGMDYTAVVGGSATIAAGTTSTTITVNLTDDYIADNGETFDVTLSTTSPDAVISPTNGTATATIEDDSKAGTPYDDSDDGTEAVHEYVTLKLIALDDTGNEVGLANSVTEGSAASYMVVAEDPNGARITTATGTVNVVVSDGTALATNLIAGMPGDYDGTSPITVTLGTAFTVQTTDDFTADNGETFSVAIANDQSYSNATAYENVVHDTTPVTTTIVDDVDVTILSISGDNTVDEGAVASYTLTVGHAPEQDLVVEVTISHITTDSADFDPTLSYTQNITILAGQTTSNFTIDNFDDTVYEGAEDYEVAITNTTGGNYEQLDIGTQNVTTTITDNETPPELSIDDMSVDEDAGTMTFTVSMTGTAQADVTFDYASQDQTPASAEAGKDYDAVSGTGTITAGATTTTITVPITDDYLAEGSETFEVLLSNPSANATIADATGVGTITDEATPGVEDTVYVQLTGNASAVEDDAATLDHKLLLVDANGQPVTLGATDSITVTLSYTSDTTESADFDTPNGKKTTLTFTGADLTGANNNEYDFSNLIADDVLAEGTESYTLSIASVSDDNGVFEKLEAHQTSGSNDSVTGSITDDVNPDAETALVSISGAQTIIEGETSTVYTVSVDQPAADVTSDINVAITYSGTATDGSDYTSVQNVTIAAGSNTATFTLDTLDDFIADDAETIVMNIGTITDSNFENIAADATANTVTSTIVDDTNPGTEPDQEIAHVAITGAQTIYEGDTSTPYTLTIDRPAGEVSSDITVALSYSGVALDGTDYTGVASVTILAGTNSVDFSIATLDDALIEGSEDFTITIGTITDSNFESLIADPANDSVTSTIIDNVDAIDDNATVVEGDNTITGNLLSNDETGDSGVISSFTYTKEDGSLGTGTVGTQVDTIYGLLTLEANGDYTYISDHNETHPAGNSLIDNINYTLTDLNGKTDTALFTVDVTDGADPVIGTPVDGSVDESALPDGTAPGTTTTTGSLAVSTAGTDTLNIAFDTTQSAPAGLSSNGKAITYVVAGSTLTAVDSDGNNVFTVSIDDPTNPASNYTFTLIKPLDHTAPNDTSIALDFAFDVVDQDGDSAGGSSFTVTINDDVPTAVDDSNTITEDALPDSVTGNVITDGVDTIGADQTVAPVTDVSSINTTATGVIGTALVGEYGTITLNADGSYDYQLDNSNLVVQGLTTNESLTETFNYTITDSDGDTSSADLVITIDGTNDGVDLIVTDSSVNESGLPAGSTAGDGSQITAGSFSLQALDGLQDIVIDGGNATTITKTQLENAASTPISVDTGEGTMEINGYAIDAAGVMTVNYTYTLNANQTHTQPADDTTLIDAINITVNDTDGDTTTSVLNITINDDVPTAVADTNTITEDAIPNTVTGNVVTGASAGDVADVLGADTTVTPVSAVETSGGSAGVVNGATVGLYGTLTLNDDGSYSYVLDNTNLDVQGLSTGETLTEIFNYTITDSDGDSSTTTLSITVNGADDGVELSTNPNVVNEAGLSDGSLNDGSNAVSDTFTYKALDGLKEIVIDGGNGAITISDADMQNIGTTPVTIDTTEGLLELNAYSKATDGTVTVNYTYTLKDNISHPNAGADTLTDSISVTVRDTDTPTADEITKTIDISIVDDVPTAVNDTNTITEDATPASVTGSLASNDTIGADTTTAPVTDVEGTAVVSGSSTTIVGSYGTLLIDADGAYSYTLDNANLAVQDLTTGETLNETFTYTITDSDGDTATADLIITVEGSNDTVALVVNDGTVAEAGLDTVGSQPATDSEKLTNQQFSFTALDGLKEVEIAGTVISATDLENLTGPAAGAISTGEGEITLTAYNKAADGTVTVTYDYTLTSAQDHSGGAVTDAIDVTVRDTDSDVATQTINITIVDDVPTATEDTASITEDAASNIVNGNVVANDTQGADRVTVTAIETVGGATGTPDGATVLTGLYGTLTMAADGNYVYTMDNANPQVNALNSGESLNEVFNYTVTDGDGDTSTSRLTIIINGANDAPIAIDHTDDYHEDPIVAGSVNGTSNLLDGATDVDDADSSLIIGTVNGAAGNVGAAVAVTLAYTDKDGNAAIKDVNVTVKADGTYSIAQTDLDAFPDGVVGTGTLTYQVSDPTGDLSGTQTLTINVTGDNDAPDVGIVTTDTLLEDDIVAGNVSGNVNLLAGATDIDDASAVLTVGTINGDTAKVGAVVPTVLTYIDKNGNTAYAVVGVTVNADGSYTVDQTDLNAIPDGVDATASFTYQVSDDQGELSTAQTFVLHVTGQNDAGVLDLDSDDSAGVAGSDYQTTFKEGSGGVAIADLDTSVTDVDSANMQNATIVLTNPLGTDTFDVSGVDPKFGATVTSAGGVITVTLNGNYSLADYEAAIEAVKYDNTDAVPTEVDRTVTVTLNDGFDDTNTATATIHVDATPTAVADTADVVEGGNTVTDNLLTNDDKGTPTATVTGFTYTDETGTVLNGTIGVAADTKYGTITVNADGTYTYVSDAHEDHAADGNTDSDTLPDSIGYTMQDGNGDTSSSTLTVNVQDTIATVAPATTITLDEDDLPAGSTPTPADLTVSNTTLSITAGADPISDVKFDLIKVQADPAMTTLNSGGQPLVYSLNGDHQLIAKDSNGADVFVVTINDDGSGNYNELSTYTFELRGVLDHPTANAQDILAVNVPFSVIEVNNANGEDTIDSNILVNVIDDVPTANDDAAQSIVEGQDSDLDGNIDTLSGNVLTGSAAGEVPDTQGADGALLQDFSYLDASGTSQTLTFTDGIDQTVTTPTGVLTVNRDGSWSFVPVASFDHDNNLSGDLTDDATNGSFTYTLVDGDGDTDTGAQTINVTDGAIPTIDNANNTIVEVYEGDTISTFDGVGNYDEANGDVTMTSTSTITHKLDFSEGSDTAGISEITWTTENGTFTEILVDAQGTVVNASVTITDATQGVLTVNYDGTWEYTPPASYTHPNPPANPGYDINNFQTTFTYKVHDIDNDEVINGSQTIQVDDTLATIDNIDPSVIDEKNLDTGTDPDVPLTTQTGDIVVDDTKLGGSYDITINAPVDTVIDSGFTSNGATVNYTVLSGSNGHKLVAYTGTDYTDTTKYVYTVEITNPDGAGGTTPGYTNTLLDNLDNGPAGDDLVFDVAVVLTDDDGDTSPLTINVTVIDDKNVPTTDTLVVDEEGLTSSHDTSEIINTNANATPANTTITTQGTYGYAEILANGQLKYTPSVAADGSTPEDTNYSGEDTVQYTYVDANGVSHVTNVTVTVDPISDKPILSVDNTTIGTDEDTAVALGLNVPVVADSSDQNGASTGDDPERLGAITLSGLPNGAELTYGGNTYTSTGANITVVISNLDENGDGDIDHVTGTTGTLTMTKAEFEAMTVKPPAQSGNDMSVTMSVTSYEVDSSGNRIADSSGTIVAGATSTTTVDVEVQAVTDPVVMTKDSDASGDEDSWIRVDDTFTITPTVDTDGSESYEIVFTGTFDPNARYYVGTTPPADMQDQTLGDPIAGGTFTVSVSNSGGVPQFPQIYVMTPDNDSTDVDTINVTVNVIDSDSDHQPNPPIITQSDSVTIDLNVTPVANDIAITTDASSGNEDTLIDLNLHFNVNDTLAVTGNETVTSVTIADIPDGAKIYKADGTTLVFENNTGAAASTTITIDAATPISDVEAFKILPPGHSSLDFTLQVSATTQDVDDGGGQATDVTGTIAPIAVTVAVSPVSETDSTNTADIVGYSGNDVKVNDSHDYATHVKEDEWFDLNTADSGFELKVTNEDDASINPHGSEITTIIFKDPVGVNSSGNPVSLIGVQLEYTDTTGTHQVVLTPSVEIPLDALDTVKILPPSNYSGPMSVDMQVKTVDYDEDDNTPAAEALSDTKTLTFDIDPVADSMIAAIAQASGDEDAGREADGTITVSSAANGIVMDVKVKSLDTDGSEHVNVYFDKIPEDAAIYYDIDKDGVKDIITKDGIYDPATGTTTAIADVPNAPDNAAGSVPAIEVDAANHTWKLLVDNFTDTGAAARDQPLIIPQHNSNENITIELTGYGVDSNGSIIDTSAVTPPYNMDVIVKGVADDVVNNEIYQQDIDVTVDPTTLDLTVTLDAGKTGKYSAVVEEDMGNTQVGAEFNLKDIYKTPDSLDSYDNLYSNDPSQTQTADTSVASETVSVTITGLDSNFDIQGATLVNGTDATRVWVTTAADIAAGNVTLTTIEHYSGEVNFAIDYVTTENDGDTNTSSTQTVSLLVTPEAEGIVNIVQTTTDVNEDVLTKMTFNTSVTLPDSDEYISSMGIVRSGYTDANGTHFNGVDGADFTIYLGNDTTMSLQDAATTSGSGVTIETDSGVEFYKITDPAVFENLYVLYDADIGGEEVNPVTAHQTDFGFKFDVGDKTTAIQNGISTDLIDTESGFQNTANYTFNLTPVTDDITADAQDGDITDIDGDGNTDITVSGHDVTISGPTTIDVAIKIDGVDTANEPTSGNTNGLDADSSEQIRHIQIDGVPEGIGIVGGRFIGDVVGQPDTGIWLVDLPSPIDMDGTTQTYNLQFEVSGNYENATATPADIKISVINQEYDVSGTPQATAQTGEFTLTFTRDPGFIGTTTDAPMDIIGVTDVNEDGTIDERDGYTVDPNFDTNRLDAYQGGFKEDTMTRLGDIIHLDINDVQGSLNAEVNENINSDLFSITLEGLDTGIATVNAGGKPIETGTTSGWHIETVNGVDVYTFRGQGDQTDIQNALDALEITPVQDRNHNNLNLIGQDDINFTTTLTTYTQSGITDVVSTTFSGNIEPVTDAVTISPDIIDAVEDVEQTINFSLDTVDNSFGTDFAHLVTSPTDDTVPTTISVTYTGSTDVGNGEFGVTLGGVHFDPGETKDVPIALTGSGTIDLTFKADSNESGTAYFDYTVYSKEDNALNTNTNTGTLEIDIAPVADGLDTGGGNAKADGVEDQLFQITNASGNPFTGDLIDKLPENTTPEELKTVIIGDVPVGWLIYYGSGQTLAQNLGDAGGSGKNSWNIPLSGGTVPEIWVQAPDQVGDVTETFQLITGVVDGGQQIQSSVPIDVTVAAVADVLTLNPSPTGGIEGDKIILNFNTSSLDVDGSETYEVKLTGLGEGAIFYLNSSEITAVTYTRGATPADSFYTITDPSIKYDTIDNLEIVQNDIQVDVKTVITVHDGGSTFTSSEETFNLNITQQQATAGNDNTLLYDVKGVDGLGGDDTVVFGTNWDGANTIDMTVLSNVETFDLTQHGNHEVTLNPTDVTAMTDSRNALTIESDGGDIINMTNDGDDAWARQGSTNVFENADGTVVTINGTGTVNYNTGGDDVLGYIDSSVVDGGAGNDRLIIFDGVDDAMISYSNIKNIETIDLKVKGDHDLGVLSLADVVDVTDSNKHLTIEGDSADALAFDGTTDGWVKGSSDGTYTSYTNTNDPSVLVKVDDDVTVTVI